MFSLKLIRDSQEDEVFKTMSTQNFFCIEKENEIIGGLFIPNPLLYLLDKDYYKRCMEMDKFYSIGINDKDQIESFLEFFENWLLGKQIKIDIILIIFGDSEQDKKMKKSAIDKLYFSERFNKDIYILREVGMGDLELLVDYLPDSILDKAWKEKSDELQKKEQLMFNEYCRLPYKIRFKPYKKGYYNIDSIKRKQDSFNLFDLSCIGTNDGYIGITFGSVFLGKLKFEAIDDEKVKITIGQHNFKYRKKCKHLIKGISFRYCNCDQRNRELEKYFSLNDEGRNLEFCNQKEKVFIIDGTKKLCFPENFKIDFY